MTTPMRPLVSVIVPTHNCAATIEQCLSSVQAQTYPHVEIIVVDNNSDDGTPQIAAEYAQVLQAGPERSAQINHGARHARGTYLYRIDGDFDIDPAVIAACVEAVEQDDLDAVAVPNRSSGESYWAQVRTLERDTYLDDSLIVAARFWKRSVFEAVGGFDESLVACEDYDLHIRLLDQGYKVGRVTPVEIHLGEANSLWAYAAQSFYYGPSILRYLRKHPRRGVRQMFPLRSAYVRHRQMLARHSRLLPGLGVLKAVQYIAAAVGILAHELGLANKGRLSPNAIAALVLVLIALLGLTGSLSHFGIQMGAAESAVVCAGGIALWQIIGRHRARRRGLSLSQVLPEIAVAFSPLLVTPMMGMLEESGLARESGIFILGLAVATWVAWLIYLAGPVLERWDESIGPAMLVIASVVGFVAVSSIHSLVSLRAFSTSTYDLALYDQALWTSAHGQDGGASLSNLLYTSLYGQSIFAKEAVPVLLLFLPMYALGIGGPALLLISRSITTGLAAIALYRLAVDEIGRTPAVLIATAYLVYFMTVRVSTGNFSVIAFATPLILFALDAYRHHRYVIYYTLNILALACGVDAGMAVAALGLYLVLFRRDHQQGFVTLGLGLGWSFVAVTAFIPFFGGAAAQVLAPYNPPGEVPFLTHLVHGVIRPDALRYIGSLLAPLGFLPVLGAPLLLPALPRLLFNLLAAGSHYTSLYGWYEPTILPFLFVAAVRGVQWLKMAAKAQGWPPPQLAGSVFITTACLVTTVFLPPDTVQDLRNLHVTSHHLYGYEILEQVPEGASVATQSPFGALLAHRQQMTILPQVEDADFVLFDVFHSNREPQPEMYEATLQRMFHSPIYGLRAAANGYLLFERGLDPDGSLAQLALVTEPEFEYARTVELSATASYRGFDLSATQVMAGEALYVTHYWESLAPARKSYLLFTAYPGAHRFEEIAFGLYPVDEWQPGDIVRHEQAVTLPVLPDGDEYEIAVGLWSDEGDPVLRSPEQLLGNDVIRIATITARDGHYEIKPWASFAAEGTR
jgi:uncharacterized membrane protein/glycosyltransferase involved in cell wall biosynthesis